MVKNQLLASMFVQFKNNNRIQELAFTEYMVIEFTDWMKTRYKRSYNYLWEEIRDDFEIPSVKTTAELYNHFIKIQLK